MRAPGTLLLAMASPASGRIERHRGALRAGLIALVVLDPLTIAVWGLIAPHSFYAHFPGDGRHWVSALPPYNEHLLRDFAAAELGYVVLLGAAAIYLERRLVQVALVAWGVAALPHLGYHLTTTGHYSTSDNVLSIGGLAIAAMLPFAMLLLTRQPVRPAAAGP